ncbi:MULTISPECIES: zinc-ribbon domain-containing protein [unclassified Curtobacterium]|uniref:zinc-ribbon domain-containing protein n=1 Tax=unclassified Curtobacterium TaxID=257496 RepID=UPI000DAA073D|nr:MULTISPECIES: zinc-ribbon domain-containing protein [unclassified Curtobacterium]PZE24191.1 zinc-ribbon domain-containing protein [Curtobacterium sp. MCBD17_028]PZE73399.1 zinc-ribbon domain-containing protein [Curtobacterium sp. MCBD17_019]PZF55500.1 zinc-ribbon domain-containing protein [Curtobacterium sp. MCBD17_034]PZF58114.1 zinc-ribbon domain-containing protein [Curtobacterium sp. MCBD17_013]PZM34731.1 zinc-ribbon domain-containing protein [Curtobacterium sp. MCBD17_031]
MFLLLGSRTTQAVLNLVAFVCGYCGVHAQQRVVKRSTKLTLFFVPLFPISTSYVNECTNCGAVTRITAAQARHSLTWSAEQARSVR